MKIAVGLSGGVDSTLTALLLQEQGHEVIGLSMSIYNRDLPENSLLKNSFFVFSLLIFSFRLFLSKISLMLLNRL